MVFCIVNTLGKEIGTQLTNRMSNATALGIQQSVVLKPEALGLCQERKQLHLHSPSGNM